MSFNLFGPATICDIRVGYISTDRGYIDDVSRYDANKYAQLNPGTQFIVKNRDVIRYLNINEVNKLTPDDLLPKTIPNRGCDESGKNTFGLDIYNPDGSLKEDATGIPGTPRIYINGGGGVGAVANPVIGNDGSLLAVDLVDGGYGYRFPPQVDIVDLDGVGAGAVAIASLCPPSKVGTLQTFENEEDFEEYDLKNCAPEETDFGRRVGADGEDLGEWDPSLYASLKVDPIRREIFAYQQFLSSLRNGWWNTRKAKPIEIIGGDKKGLTKFDVQHWAWGGSREVKKIPNKKENFKEVEFKVYTQGGQDRGLMFTFVEKNGDHRFKIKADSYPDGAKGQKVSIKVKRNSIYTVTASGQFRGKGVEQGLLKNFGRKAKELDKRFTDGTKIFADFTASSNDNDDLQIEATQGKFKTDNRRQLNGHSTYDLTYQLEDSGQFRVEKEVVKKIDDSFMNSYAISPVPPSNVPGSDFAGIQYSVVYEEDFPYDGEYIFKAMADNVGEVYVDNESIFQFRKFKGGPDVAKKNIKAGVHKIRCDLYNIPQFEKVIKKGDPSNITFKITTSAAFANGIKIPELNIDVSKKYKGKQLKETFNRNIEYGTEYDVITSSGGRGRIKLRTAGKNVLQMEESTDNDWQDLVCSASGGRFIKINGNRCKLIFDAPVKVVTSGKSNVSTTDKPEVVFNTLDYINKADRKLFKINPNPGKDSDFLNRFGVLPFNPAAVEKEDVLVPVKSPPQPKPKASIVKRGDELFLKVTGGGRVKIDFKLKVDDNLFTSGVFAREVIIDTDDNDLKLRRDLREENSTLSGKKKETITGSGTFTGGKGYRIKVIGGSPTSGFKTIDKTTVGFDDDITNGYDENGLLKITNVRAIQENESRYVTRQNEVTKVVKRYSQKPNASTDAYAGVHIIRWESIDFPVDGNYTISTMVDDNVRIFIGNRDGAGKKEIGNGLRSVEKGGDEVIIEKRGFADGTSTGKSVDTRFFKKGKYRIRVELEQIPGKPLAKGNPMAVAIQIKTPTTEVQEVLSRRSWNQNPMGVALTIDPPLPPIPQEPIPKAPGRCPNNPIWSTRFPDGQKKWWPVTHSNKDGTKTWSKFMNRFAISPIPPLITKGSAQGGVVFTNSWNLEVPYDGFYGMKGTVDNGGRILIDDKVILEGGYFSGSSFSGRRTLEGFATEVPQTVKFPLTKGNHTVTVEVENRAQTKQKKIKNIIFDTANWVVSSPPRPQTTKVNFRISSDAKYANKIVISELNINESKRYGGPQLKANLSRDVEVGKVYEVELFSPESKRGIRLRSRGSVLEMEEASDNDYTDIICGATEGRFFDFRNGTNSAKCKFIVPYTSKFTGLTSGTQKNGVTYSGPELASYRSGTLGPFLTPKFLNDQDYIANFNGTTWVMKWSNVNFPVTGRYRIRSEADDILSVKIDGAFISEAKTFGGVKEINFSASEGNRIVEMELTNLDFQREFNVNPTVFNVIIDYESSITVPAENPWRTNPIGISAILIPPPCPLETKGLGKVCDIKPIQPGNGYTAPPGPGYPAVLEVITLEPENPGINYGPDDVVCIIKEDGTKECFPPNLGPFGANLPIDVLVTTTTYPNIVQSSPTGVNSRFRPVIRVRRDPLDVDPDQILQVTDLVGLKRTGYVDGREYFGAVFYKDGVRFAGYYETAGQLIQVYDTLQESIDGEVTTRPSAILRQGTDITSNDPRLNIPGTPDNLT